MPANNPDAFASAFSFAPSEHSIWGKPTRPVREKMSDDEIDEKYVSKAERIVTEMNREKLPNFVDALKREKYMVLRPAYQRRRRWDPERQSRLIESFLMNIPVPPLFIYETSLNRYEVMDGQQRITAVKAFYDNDLVLTGLERWPELNGKKYLDLPTKIRAGIDRRSISYVILLTESAQDDEDALLLKELVFERLNTGGVRLSQQEVRNCLYQGTFNELVVELGKSPLFRKTWELPPFSETELTRPSDDLLENPFYSRMRDLEVILRFFALRHHEHYQRGMQGFLDLFMVRSKRFTDQDITVLRKLFTDTLTLAVEVFRERVFVPFNRNTQEWEKHPHVAFADSVMVGLSAYLDKGPTLIEKRDDVIVRTKQLFLKHEDGTFAGRANTKKDVENRINLFRSMLGEVLS